MTSFRKREEELWHQWKQSGFRDQAVLQQLLQSLRPLVNKTFAKYRAADVSPIALKIEIENQLIEGLKTYNPSKGSLTTHLNWRMRNVGRFVERHQNVARIPGSRIRLVGKLQQAEQELATELGRAPTLEELAKKSKIKKTTLEKLRTELRPVHFREMFATDTGAPAELGEWEFNADLERLNIVYYDLTPIEQAVVDYTLGRNGKPKITSTTQLARLLNVSPARISNVRKNIAKKMKRLNWIR